MQSRHFFSIYSQDLFNLTHLGVLFMYEGDQPKGPLQ